MVENVKIEKKNLNWSKNLDQIKYLGKLIYDQMFDIASMQHFVSFLRFIRNRLAFMDTYNPSSF